MHLMDFLYPYFQGQLIGPGQEHMPRYNARVFEISLVAKYSVLLDTTTFGPSYSQTIVSNELRVCIIHTYR